jgi:hypothetical protein
MYTDVATDWLAQQAALEPMQQKFLQKALNYYQKFAGDVTTDTNGRLKTAAAYRRVAEIEEKLSHYSISVRARDERKYARTVAAVDRISGGLKAIDAPGDRAAGEVCCRRVFRA